MPTYCRDHFYDLNLHCSTSSSTQCVDWIQFSAHAIAGLARSGTATRCALSSIVQLSPTVLSCARLACPALSEHAQQLHASNTHTVPGQLPSETTCAAALPPLLPTNMQTIPANNGGRPCQLADGDSVTESCVGPTTCDVNAVCSNSQCSCKAGWEGNGESCTQCLAGTWQDGTYASCQQCPEGFTTAKPGATSSTSCTSEW